MMLLIFSKNQGEMTTDKVMNWLYSNKARNFSIVRINGDDLLDKEFEINLDENLFIYNKMEIKVDKTNVVWFRRTFDEDFFTIEPLLFEDFENNKNLSNHLLTEIGALYNFFESLFENAQWINKYSDRINKLKNLILAKKHGIHIPNTHIVNRVSNVNKLLKNGEFITKSISDAASFYENEFRYSMYTSRIKKLTHKENIIFPSKLQLEIYKKFELRIFYLQGEFFSMAIFSQNDIRTQIDFRNYNLKKPNRFVPYELPNDIKSKLKGMIADLNLPSCSIDMIVSKEDVYYFLEINPVGQFGMISKPCNYFLEKKFADYINSLNDQKK